jgi:hypothetical protein
MKRFLIIDALLMIPDDNPFVVQLVLIKIIRNCNSCLAFGWRVFRDWPQ